MIRRAFYLLVGFSFPIFWALHAEGLLADLYRPIQRLFHVSSAGWPSFLSACLLYIIIIICFELVVRAKRDLQP